MPVIATGASFGAYHAVNLAFRHPHTVQRVALGMERRPDQLREVGQTLAFLRQPEPPRGLTVTVNGEDVTAWAPHRRARVPSTSRPA